jgi:hypothetical protein
MFWIPKKGGFLYTLEIIADQINFVVTNNPCDTRSLWQVVSPNRRRPSVLPDESTGLNEEQLGQWSKVLRHGV